jgi:hypothetical protein
MNCFDKLFCWFSGFVLFTVICMISLSVLQMSRETLKFTEECTKLEGVTVWNGKHYVCLRK